MRIDDILKLLGDSWTGYKDLVRDTLRSNIEALDVLNTSLMSNVGKQLRPVLSLLVSHACGGCNKDSLHFAAASEVLHNATLFHDDVADGSATRRGKPSLASAVGPRAAVLVGDFWLSKAISLILGTKHQNKAIPLFSVTLCNLAEGEMLQLSKTSGATTTEEDYKRIIYCKTASLFESCCRAGALAMDAPALQFEAAGSYGAALGMACQIKDDILDYSGGASVGKPLGEDLAAGLVTLPLLGALRAFEDESEVRSKVLEIKEHPESAASLRSFVLDNGGIEYAAGVLDSYISEALDALSVFPDSPFKDALVQIARYNAIRES